MVKMNLSGLALLAAVALGLGTAPAAEAQDPRAPMVRQSEARPEGRERAPVHVAQARGGVGQRRDDTHRQRASAIERRDDRQPAQRTRAEPPRERAQSERAGHAPHRGR